MLRAAILGLSRSRALAEWVPRYRFARTAARRFMPGEEVTDALAAATAFQTAGLGSILTQLGENIASPAAASAVAAHYHDVLDSLAARGLTAQISVKLTQLGIDIDVAAATTHVASLAAHAARAGSAVWIDMESSAYTARTLAAFRDVLAEHRNVGLCLQAYLHRTPADLEAILPLTTAVRLVKGAYAEPGPTALQRRADIDAAFVALAARLLAAVRQRRADPVDDAALAEPRPALGTHDTRLIDRIAAAVAGQGVARSAYEVQMLYGIRPTEQRRLAADGYNVSVLINYGRAWYPWFMRRVAERPANVLFLVRSVFSS